VDADTGAPAGWRKALPWVATAVLGMALGASYVAFTAPAPTPPPPARSPASAASSSPVAAGPMTLSISARDCAWGTDFDHYYGQANALRLRTEQTQRAELDSLIMRVPMRSWRGLTVGGVAALHDGKAVIFRESVAIVRQNLRDGGVVIGERPVPTTADPHLTLRLVPTAERSARYGQTMLQCTAA
jgi:hypothetical protein